MDRKRTCQNESSLFLFLSHGSIALSQVMKNNFSSFLLWSDSDITGLEKVEKKVERTTVFKDCLQFQHCFKHWANVLSMISFEMSD